MHFKCKVSLLFPLFFLVGCSNQPEPIAEHECIPSSYTWCSHLNECVIPADLAKAQNIENTPTSITSFCNLPIEEKKADKTEEK